MVKKFGCLLLSLLFVISVAACGGSESSSSDDSSSKDNSSLSSGLVESGGIVDVSVDSELIEQSELANKDFGGKEFQFYFWYKTNEITTRKVNEFNKKHNANVKITVGTSFQEDLAKSIAGGNPYAMSANSARFFPQTIFANLYEPLNDYVKDVDYFNAEKPENGGISKEINESFSWNGKFYATGSAKACYSYAFYYNKKRFADDGLEDPYELWKKGEWTWDKVLEQGKQITDISNGVGYLSTPELNIWLALNGLNYIKKSGENVFSDNLGDKDVVAAINAYRDLALGTDPICIVGAKQLSWYANITYTDAYTQLATQVKMNSNFSRNVANLGVVPVPTGLNKSGKYSTHTAQGYSAIKGSPEPSLAPCYALFESRVIDSDVGSEFQMPSEIRNAIDNAFATNGFCPIVGFNVTGLNAQIGWPIIKGQSDVTATINDNRSLINTAINATLAEAKNFKG